MKNAVIRLTATALLLLCCCAAQAADIKVKIKGVKGSAGNVLVAPGDDSGPSILRGKKLPVAEGVFETTLKRLSPGPWKIYVFHDANANRKWDRDDRDNPLEGWAIVDVTVKDGYNSTVTIELKYP